MTTMSVVPCAVHKIITTIQPFYFTQKARGALHLEVAVAASSSKSRPDCLHVAARAAETQEGGTGESGAVVSVEGKASNTHILTFIIQVGEGARGLLSFRNNNNKKHHTIKACIFCSWLCPGTSAPSMAQRDCVLDSLGSNLWCVSRALKWCHVSSKRRSRVRDGD